MVVKFNFLSVELRMQTNVTMILPSFGFDNADDMDLSIDFYKPGMKFKAMYLFHGGFGDDSDYLNYSNILRYAEKHKVAVIMPCGYNSGYQDWDTGSMMPSKYWKYVFEELPKVCATMFPISTKREDTFVGGLSMGGIGALKMAIYGADRVSAALLMSGIGNEADALGKLDVENQEQSVAQKMASKVEKVIDPSTDLYRTAKRIAEEGKPLPKFYLTCGSDDFILPAVKGCRDLLKEYGYDVMFEEVLGYGHEWDFWDLSLRKAFDEWLPL